MARIKVDIPDDLPFSTLIPIRITDLNYGGHVGNDTILSLIHEARVQFLKHHGYEELAIGGAGLIMGDAAIEFKNELFYGDTVQALVGAGDFSKVSFDIYYRIEKANDEKRLPIAFAKTGMICYDYGRKKVVAIPDEVRQRLESK